MFFLSSAYAFIYLSIIPGFFIKRLLRIQNISFFESITYIVGLSISYLYLVGISTNSLTFLLHTSHPLSITNSLVVFDVYTLLLLLINQLKKGDFVIYMVLSEVTFTGLLFYIIPFFFPILSIAGVQLLDSNGTNTFTMILLSFIAIYIFLAAIFIKRLEGFHFEVPVYLIATSLLFIFSLRSSYIIGWDIYQEYKVFLLTESHQLWNMQDYKDPYNACLSLTILPTLFHYFTKVDNPFVFKILYELFFALVPITIYSVVKRFSNCFIALLCAFFFMSTEDFFLEMPAIVRQEIAFLFFGLILSTLFNKQLAPLQKKILFVIFSASIVLSHYSTAYILIALFGFTCVMLTVQNKIAYRHFHVIPKNFTLAPLPVIIFILFAYLWFGVVTNASSNFISVLNEAHANITNFDKQTLNTSIVDQLINFPKTENVQTLLVKDINDASDQYSHNNFTYYPASTYKGYSPAIIDKDASSLHVSDKISNGIYFISNSLTKIMKLLIIIGFMSTIILFRKKFFPAEYGILSVGFAIALILLTSVPAISLFYPIGRLDQQTLFLIALPTILSISWLLRFLPYKIRMLLITVFFITYFLNTTTFTSQVIGGQDPQIFLNNSGLYYNEIYLHPSEIASIHWLYSNNTEQASVFADIGSYEKMVAYSGQKYLTVYMQVFPSLIDKNGYVYSSYANTLHAIGIVNLKDMRMEYNFPNKFLNNNKNLIYNNHDTQIYK
jgi:uncharacterized membrane protein